MCEASMSCTGTLLGTSAEALSRWLQFEVCQGDNCYFTLQSLIILCPSYLLFMVMNGGLSTPGGLFMPSIMVVPCTEVPLASPSRHVPWGLVPLFHALCAIIKGGYGMSAAYHLPR